MTKLIFLGNHALQIGFKNFVLYRCETVNRSWLVR